MISLSTYQRPLRDQKVEDNKYQNLIHLNISDNTKLRLNCSLEKRLPVFIEFCFATNSVLPPRKGAPESIVENFLILPVGSGGLQNIFQGPKHFSNLRKNTFILPESSKFDLCRIFLKKIYHKISKFEKCLLNNAV